MTDETRTPLFAMTLALEALAKEPTILQTLAYEVLLLHDQGGPPGADAVRLARGFDDARRKFADELREGRAA